jgi:hypothetical protein
MQGAPSGALTLCPSDQVGQVKVFLLFTIAPNATDPTKLDAISAHVCSIELPTVTEIVGTCDPTSPSLVTTALTSPHALSDALSTAATAQASGVLSSSMPGATATFAPLTVVLGSNQPAPNLPKWDTTTAGCNAPDIGSTATCDAACVSDCSGLQDADGDTFPGITMNLCGKTQDDVKNNTPCHADMPTIAGATMQGSVYLDLGVGQSFLGTAKSSCELSGKVAPTVAYGVVGANVYLAGQPVTVSSVSASLPTFQSDSQTSSFHMVRIDGMYGAPDWSADPNQADLACKAVIAHASEL